MADKKISALTPAAALTGTEDVPIVQSAATVRTTTQDIADLYAGGVTSLESMVGAITLQAGDGVTITPLTGNVIEISSTATGGVSSLNGMIGDIQIEAGANISVDILSGNVISISSTASGGVTSLNALDGAVTLQGDGTITVTPLTGNVIELGIAGGAGVSALNGLSGAVSILGSGHTSINTGTGNAITVDTESSVWYTGSGAPSDAIGQDNDFYIDNASGDYYQKQSGVFVLVGNLRGPAGTNGIDGVDGTSGVGTYLVSGATIAWQTGYEYEIGAASYYVSGVLVASATQDVTLDAADPTDDRIDVLVLDGSGVASAITGTPSADPAEPSVDPAVYLRLGIVYVSAGSTEPEVTQTLIYGENVEWTATASAGTINVNSTNNPRSGTKDIEGTNVVANQYVTLVMNTTPLVIDLATEVDSLVFYVRVKAAWPSTKAIRLGWYSGGASGTLKGSQVTISNGVLGFNSASVGSYQQIVVPISVFNVPVGTLVDTLRLTIVGSGANVGFYWDDIILQAGVPSTTSAIWRWRGAWNSSVVYEINDAVSLSGSSYVAIGQNQNKNPSTNPLSWATIAAKGDTGTAGATINGLSGDVTLQGAGGTTVSILTGNVIEVSSSATGGVSSLNSMTGAVTLQAGSNVTITPLTGNVIAIAASGGGLSNWTDAVNTSAPNATVPAASLTATNAATNVDAAIVPKGTGALLAAVPDNTAAGGDKRGTNTVDLQTERNNTNQVASGNSAVIVGGGRNRTTANYSAILGGYTNLITATYGAILGGNGNSVSASYGVVGGGQTNSAAAINSFIGCGASNTVSGAAQYGFIGAGGNQTCSGVRAGIVSGQYHTASGDNSFVGGGYSNTASGVYAAVLGGNTNNASGQSAAIIGGETNAASANYSTVTGGTDNTADAQYATASGRFAATRSIIGLEARASGRHSNTGDAQLTRLALRNSTIDATPKKLASDGSTAGATNQMVLRNNSALYARVTVVARKNTNAEWASFEGSVLISRAANAASTALVGSPTLTQTFASSGATGWSVAASADTTNGALSITVTGGASDSVFWTARIDAVEC